MPHAASLSRKVFAWFMWGAAWWILSSAQAQTVTPPPLTLEGAIEQALKNNLSALAAAERIQEAQAGRNLGLSALLPNVSGSAYQANLTSNLAAMGLPLERFGGIPPFLGPFNRFDARVQMVASVFNLESIRHYRASRYGVRLAEQQRRLAIEQVTTAAALSYLAALEAGQSVSAAEANVALAQRLRDLAVNQRSAGLATGLDVTRAETRLANQQVQLEQARTNRDTARLNLLRTIGAPLAVTPALAGVMRFQPEPPPAAADAVERAWAGRIEIQVAAEQVRLAEAEHKAAVAGWLPTVSVFGDYGSSGLKPNEVNLPTRTIGVRVDVPVFNGGRTRATAQAAASRERQARLLLADLRAAVEKDVRQALDHLATREKQVRAAEKSLALAERELDLAQDRFRNGVADNVEVVEAQTALAGARFQMVSSLAQYQVARLNLAAALGRAGDFRL